jgi:hypothetical protein
MSGDFISWRGWSRVVEEEVLGRVARAGRADVRGNPGAAPVGMGRDAGGCRAAGGRASGKGQRLGASDRDRRGRASGRHFWCSVCRDTPTFAATCDTDNPSLITANTARYLCSATLNSLITGVSRISRSNRQASAETLSDITRSRNLQHQPRSCSRCAPPHDPRLSYPLRLGRCAHADGH